MLNAPTYTFIIIIFFQKFFTSYIKTPNFYQISLFSTHNLWRNSSYKSPVHSYYIHVKNWNYKWKSWFEDFFFILFTSQKNGKNTKFLVMISVNIENINLIYCISIFFNIKFYISLIYKILWQAVETKAHYISSKTTYSRSSIQEPYLKSRYFMNFTFWTTIHFFSIS